MREILFKDTSKKTGAMRTFDETMIDIIGEANWKQRESDWPERVIADFKRAFEEGQAEATQAERELKPGDNYKGYSISEKNEFGYFEATPTQDEEPIIFSKSIEELKVEIDEK